MAKNVFRVFVGCPPLLSTEKFEVHKRRFRAFRLNADGSEDTGPGGELKNEVVDMAGESALNRSFDAIQDDMVKFELFNIDDKGNQSTTALVSDPLTIIDTFPPNSPIGSFAVTMQEVGDVDEEDPPTPTPEPVPESEPTPTPEPEPVVNETPATPADGTSEVQSRKPRRY